METKKRGHNFLDFDVILSLCKPLEGVMCLEDKIPHVCNW